ncbi:TPM domain-containing protein [Pseudogulbenkiania subflava]|uniref:TLP18.3, Psb32 and MOLO-1 founding protein of phosphatase n=1 Tax=Pseudogulbenkiania subflava DSM 22618 TaxID=1123014 RepID=A0A1Y6BXJ9_9NEIS|nr:TPM domain-containing protein [Pseudogulbenkiania subflava]SMF33090.1 TLP18.3, Psb32 and MOLO-1 founding protein of phosphatase [Pseudogulbenkiania subflava DSM 22618]
MAIFRVFALVFTFFVAASVQAEDKASSPAIIDSAHVLTSDQVSELDTLISHHNRSSPEYIRLIVVPRLPPNTTIEDYSNSILQNDLSTPGASPYRALFVVDMDDRKFIIDTTPSVRSTLPDEFVHEIIGNVIEPQFRAGQFFSGIKGGLIAIASKLNDDRRVMENSVAKITKLSCSGGGCMAAIESTDRRIMLIWGSLIGNSEDGFMAAWIDAQDGDAKYGHEYSLISSNGNTLEIGVLESPEFTKKENIKKSNGRRIITATRDASGVYSFIPLELMGIGKILMKKSPVEPDKFLVGGPTLNP